MSLPTFPARDASPAREDAINQIISSIAMEELGLSHIINAEGEKLQYALGTIPGITGPGPLTMEELLTLNQSVQKTLDSTMMNQYFLKEKLVGAFSAAVLQGPTGPTGPQGPATIDVVTAIENLEPGEQPYVANDGTDEDVILRFGIPRGATGAVPTIEVADTQTIEPGLNADVSSAATATGVALSFQIPRGATGANGAVPTVAVTSTTTVEPDEDASVTATPTATGVDLSFQIPRGATGISGVSGIQMTLNSAGGAVTQIPENGVIGFNQTITRIGTDISYNNATSEFTINLDGNSNFYMINWWVFTEGTIVSTPVTFSLHVAQGAMLTYAPWPEMQLSGSAMVDTSVYTDPILVSLNNASGEIISLAGVNVQAQINIIGYGRVS